VGVSLNQQLKIFLLLKLVEEVMELSSHNSFAWKFLKNFGKSSNACDKVRVQRSISRTPIAILHKLVRVLMTAKTKGTFRFPNMEGSFLALPNCVGTTW